MLVAKNTGRRTSKTKEVHNFETFGDLAAFLTQFTKMFPTFRWENGLGVAVEFHQSGAGWTAEVLEEEISLPVTLPQDRQDDHFKDGEEVYILSPYHDALLDGKITQATEEGYVFVTAAGQGVLVGRKSPEVMKPEELQSLLDNPDDLIGLWVKKSKRFDDLALAIKKLKV